MKIAIVAAAAAAAALFAAGCSKETVTLKPPESAGPPPGSLDRRPGPVTPGVDPSTIPGHPPGGGAPPPGMQGAGVQGPPAQPPGAGPAADHFAAAEGWQSEAPASNMRLLQFRLPRADGDGKDGEVAVFTRIMGSAKENIDRWRGQFSEIAQGKDKLEETVEGMKGKVTLLDITGKFGGGMNPMAGAHGSGAESAETRMIAAVVEHPTGPFYVKAMGPPATMGKWEASVRAFILDAAKK